MICQDKVLKKNWDFNRGELYIIDHDRGERPRESTLETSIILWPEDVKESTRWFYVVPIMMDMRGYDPETDIPIRTKGERGRPFVAIPRKGHMVEEWRLLTYAGRLTEKATKLIDEKTRAFLLKQMGVSGKVRSDGK